MPLLDYFLGFIITVLVVIIIYKDGKEKEAIRNFDFISNEISLLNKSIHEKNMEIEKLKKEQKKQIYEDIEIL